MKIKKKDLLKLNIVFYVYSIIGIITLMYISDSFKTPYYREYVILCIAYFIVGGIFLWSIVKNQMDIFQPFILISIIYFCIFIFTPMIFIIQGKTDAHGVNIMNGCVKATIIFVFSYMSYVIGYNFYKIKLGEKQVVKKYYISTNQKRKIVIICFVLWSIAYILTLVHLFSKGNNLIQILSIGKVKAENTYGANSLMGFISNFSFCMIIPWLYICFFSKSKVLKIVITYLTLTAYIIRGFRYIIVIMGISLIITYYRKRKKTPTFIIVVLGIISLLVFIGVLGYMRNSLRTGVATDWKSFGIDNITYALESNFDIYKTFYGIVEHYPSDYSYTFGTSMFLETIVMFIPRVIWPGKPLAVDASVVLAIRRSVSEFAISNAAMATPNLGEFYVDFGIGGCLICMFIFGVISKWTTKFYFIKNDNIEYIMLYAVVMPTFLQLVIRGYTPSNFYLVVFLLAPFFIIKMFNRVKT